MYDIAQRGAEAFWRPHVVTSSTDDVARFKLSLRDVVVLVVGAAGMWGVQIATQYGMRSDIRDLSTEFRNYQRQQMDENGWLQSQIDDRRREAAAAKIDAQEALGDVKELRGFLAGVGVKNIPGAKTGGQ